MKILIVKLSSLGDVVHAMPALRDIRRALPDAQIDWVVERAFATLVKRCDGIGRVIGCDLRRWTRAPLSADTRHEWRSFRNDLRREAYDAVIDLQGLTKSALVSRAARVAPGGKRHALANQTEGAGYEAPTRWVADAVHWIEPRIHAVERSRELCALALAYPVSRSLDYGLRALPASGPDDGAPVASKTVVFVHGSSREDKGWPEPHWVELGARLVAQGCRIGLPHGSEPERQRSLRLAAALGPWAEVWPRLDLGLVVDRIASSAGVIGVDSGLSHIAVALDRPHVQIYNVDTAWRTGPIAPSGPEPPRQCSVFAAPTPSVAQVWAAWLRVSDA
jgi:heptosyltransferase-1